MSDILIHGLEMKPGIVKVEIGYDADDHPMALVGDNVYDISVIKQHGDLIDRKVAYNSLLYGMVMTGYQSQALNCIDEYWVPTVIPESE